MTSSRLIRFCSPRNTSGSCSNLLLREDILCRNWWLLNDFRRVIFPVPVILNRLTAVLFVLIFGIFLLCGVRFWGEHHYHKAPIQGWRPLHRSKFDNRFREQVKLLLAQFRVRDLARFEHARHLDFAAFFQESDCLGNVGLQIVLGNTRTDLYTLNFLLFALFIFALLALQVLVLSVVDDSTDRGLGCGTDHDEIKALFFGEGESLTALHDS